jgi:hypothetical protein
LSLAGLAAVHSVLGAKKNPGIAAGVDLCLQVGDDPGGDQLS